MRQAASESGGPEAGKPAIDRAESVKAEAEGLAVQRILAAEHRARERLAGCAAEAQRQVEAARGEARRIEDRTAEAVRGIQRRQAAWLAARLAALRRDLERSLLTCDERDFSAAVLAAATERLARRMIGWDEPPPERTR